MDAGTSTSSRPAVAILGAGSMGGALAAGLVRAGWSKEELLLVARRPERAREIEARTGIRTVLSAVEAVQDRDVVVVSVKPVDVEPLLRPLHGVLTADQVVLSLAAGVSTEMMEDMVGQVPVVRSMPNIPASVLEGITGIAAGHFAQAADVERVRQLLGQVGEVVVVDEDLLDAVTAISGTGPAYIFLVAEALTEASLREGLPRDVAEKLVHQTIKGAGALLMEADQPPSALRAQVTSPSGTTAAAMHILEGRGFRALLEDAVRAAAQRARELGEGVRNKGQES